MKLGIALPQLGNWATPENIITVSQKADQCCNKAEVAGSNPVTPTNVYKGFLSKI